MTEALFDQWEATHILATGASASQLADVLVANRGTFLGLNATYEELNECSQRILDSGVIPNWPSEHIAALVKNLHSLRAERLKRKAEGTYGAGKYSLHHAIGCDCPDCNGGEIKPSYEKRTSDRDSKLKELKAYIRRNGGTVVGDKPRRRSRT